MSNFNIEFLYRSVTSLFLVQLFLLPFSSHSSTQNIGFNDSRYVIKPPQPSSAIYGAPPFTGNQQLTCKQVVKHDFAEVSYFVWNVFSIFLKWKPDTVV